MMSKWNAEQITWWINEMMSKWNAEHLEWLMSHVHIKWWINEMLKTLIDEHKKWWKIKWLKQKWFRTKMMNKWILKNPPTWLSGGPLSEQDSVSMLVVFSGVPTT